MTRPAGVLGALTLLLLPWTFAIWAIGDLAMMDCAAEDGECRKELYRTLALYLGVPWTAWLLLAGLVLRDLKRG